MKVLHRDPEGGVVVLNPYDLRMLVSSTKRECAAVVIDGDDIVASTVYGLSHADIATRAGFCNPWFDAEKPEDPQSRMLCLMADRNGITLELWPWDDGEQCPCEPALLDELFKRVSGHRRIARLVAKGYEVDVAVFDSGGGQAWAYDGRSVAGFAAGSLRPIAL